MLALVHTAASKSHGSLIADRLFRSPATTMSYSVQMVLSGGNHGPAIRRFRVLVAGALVVQLPITNYQMAPSKRGAGGGSATHKEPT